ncbi:MAG: MurR/RpiR family transcriptional regulator [Fidelibacterota bacterium]|nr:MAG: MurR/RpiR family transcriptional regulator [Candidatus Neomarinimicrobiota bacterium]
MTEVEIKEKIRNHYQELSRNQKLLAEYIIDHLDRIPFLSVQEVSDNSGASTATIVRFAQRIGFSGYGDLKEAISLVLQESFKKNVFPSMAGLGDDVLSSVARQDLQDINDTLVGLDRDDFNRTIELILQADIVYTAGLGVSYLLAQLLAYQLNQAGIESRSLQRGSTSFLEQLLFAGEEDLLIVLSYPPYSKETIEAAKYAIEKKVKVVAITNKPASPVTFYSTISLVARSENVLYTNSFAAMAVLMNAIATECASGDKPRAEQMLHEVERIYKSYGDTIP